MKVKVELFHELQRQLDVAKVAKMRPFTSVRESAELKARHPWADLVVGDFEIRVINREKYGLDPQ